MSSTAVTFQPGPFARRTEKQCHFSAGVLLAAAIMFIRVVVEVMVVNPGLLGALWIPLTMFAGLICALIFVWRCQDQKQTGTRRPICSEKSPPAGDGLHSSG